MSQRPLTSTIIPIPTGLSRGGERWKNGLPRQSVPQGHLLRGADWLAMTRCVGADDPVRPMRPPHPVGRGPRAPPGAMRTSRRDTWVSPYVICACRTPPPSAKRTQIVNKCPLVALSCTKEFPFHSSKYAAVRYANYKKCVVSFINRVYRRFFHIARWNSKGA